MVVAMLMVVLWPALLRAQWNTNTSINEEVSTLPVADMQAVSTTDGKTWVAFYVENAGNYDMRAQLFDANGYKLLGADGMLVGNFPSGTATFVFNVCVDLSNNLIVAYQDQRSGGSSYSTVVYKVSQTGTQLWGASGIVIGTGLAPYPAALTNGEVVVTWNDEASNTLKIQKITTTGTMAWATPVSVLVGTAKTTRGQLISNTNGTFTMVYQKSGTGISTTLYAQRFNSSGTAQYSPLLICNQTTSGARYYSIQAEGDTTYFGYYSSTGFRFNSFVQRINPNGTLPWGINGSAFNTSVSSTDNYQGETFMNLTPGSPYVWSVCTFSDPNQTVYGVYVQKFLKSSGARQFTNLGKVVYPVSSNSDILQSDIALVDDAPMFMTYNTNYIIKATRLDSNGNFVWPGNSVEISSTTAGPGTPKGRYCFTPDGPNKCAGVWSETRLGVEKGYGQGVSIGGLIGIDVTTQGGAPATITTNLGTLQMVSSIFPASANQAVNWSIVSVTGNAIINATGLVTAQVSGAVYAKATSVQDITMSDSVLITMTNQTGTPTPPPTGNGIQTFCNGATVANLTAVGSNIQWYMGPAGGMPLAPTTLLIDNHHYYASQTVGGIESTARLEVIVTVITTPAPAGMPQQYFCTSGTVGQLQANGTDIKWYSTSTSGTALSPTTPLVNGAHYFASQTVSGCESTARFEVAVTISLPPSAPSGAPNQSFCQGATLSDIVVNGTDILWYASLTSVTPLPFGTVLVNATHYYATQTVLGCESTNRLEIITTVTSTPTPTGITTQEFCLAATVANLSATGTNIQWYPQSSGGSPLPGTTPLINGTHYFASQTIANCESYERLDVIASVISVNTSITHTGITITAIVNGASYQWINCATHAIIGGATGQSYTATQNGSFAVVVTQNSCSDTSDCVNITTVGLEEFGKSDKMKVYPNPATNKVTIEINPALLGISYFMIDKLGRTVKKGVFNSEVMEIQIDGLSAGLYSIVYGDHRQPYLLMKN